MRSRPIIMVMIRSSAALLLTVLVGGASLLFAQTSERGSPLPIQRILLPPETAAKELEKVQQGALVSLPLADFDARLKKLAKIQQDASKKPRLTRAHYRAEL